MPKKTIEKPLDTVLTEIEKVKVAQKKKVKKKPSTPLLDAIMLIANGGEYIKPETITRLQTNAKEEAFNSFAKEYDDEMTQKDNIISSQQEEINRLRNLLNVYDNQLKSIQINSEFSLGNEQDLYPGEKNDIILDILDAYLKNLPNNIRRYHVVKSVINGNKTIGNREKMVKDLRKFYNTYSNCKDAKALIALGYTVNFDGKHLCVNLHGDTRYNLYIAKTPSDFRGALNNFSDAQRLLF